jgi:hypothetical protein
MAQSGIHPKLAQSLARHSTITLTMDRYSHVQFHDRVAALEAVPSFLPPANVQEAQSLPAKGTDGKPARRRPRLYQTTRVHANR